MAKKLAGKVYAFTLNFFSQEARLFGNLEAIAGRGSNQILSLPPPPVLRSPLLLEGPPRRLALPLPPGEDIRRRLEKIQRKVARNHPKVLKVKAPKGTAVIGSLDARGSTLLTRSVLGPDDIVYGLPQGQYEVLEVVHRNKKTNKVLLGTSGGSTSRTTPERTRASVAAAQVLQSLEHVVYGLESMDLLSHDVIDRTLSVSHMYDRASAIVGALDGLDAPTLLPELDLGLREVLRTRPRARDVLFTVSEALQKMDAQQAQPSLDVVLAGAKLMAQAALELNFLEPMPWLAGVEDGFERMQHTFKLLSLAKSSEDPSIKARFARHFDEEILPFMRSELAFSQGLAMFLAYMPLEAGTRIRRNVTVWETDASRRLASNAVHFELALTLEHVIDEALLFRFQSMGLGFHPSAKVQFWRSMGSGTPELILSCTGTTSFGKDFDALWKLRNVTTGALGNIDPRGVSNQSVASMLDPLLAQLKKMGATRQSRITVTGHSQGGAVALRIYYVLKMLGYEHVICTAFSAPGLDEETFHMMNFMVGAEDAARDVYMIDDPKDWVPTAGEQTPLGLKLRTPFRSGRMGRKGIVDSRFDDLMLGHGSPNLVWRMIYGGPPRPSDQLAQFNLNSTKLLVEYFRCSTGGLAFTPSPAERVMAALAKKKKGETDL